MQIIFHTKQKPSAYAQGGSGEFPDAPECCPFPDCKVHVCMKKHGFYSRNVIDDEYCGLIRIRRYLCPKCRRTVSMLPDFCIPRYVYLVQVIMGMLAMFAETASIAAVAAAYALRFPAVGRRHVRHYKKRVVANRKPIQLRLNQISPGSIPLGGEPRDTEWIKGFVREVGKMHPHVFNSDFHNAIGKSFLSRKLA